MTVNRIIMALYYNPFEWPSEDDMKKSIEIHDKLGFNSWKIYRRVYEFEGERYEIFGIPDRISPDGYVEELRLGKSKDIEPAEAEANIYCWLVGLKNYRIYFYDSRKERVFMKIENEFDEKRLVKDLDEGLRRLKNIRNI